MTAPDARLAMLRQDLASGGSRLYAGTGHGQLVFAPPQQALLVLGPPRAGKTTGLVVPNVLASPGPVVSTSTKPDVLAATVASRSGGGRCWLFDPTGTVPSPPAVTRLRWSPVAASHRWDDALLTAGAMVGAARPGGRSGEAGHWTERAEALLAPLCHAAAVSGADMRTVVGWVLRQDATPALAVLSATGADLAADVLTGLTATDARERSGIWSTAAGVLAAYRSDTVLEAAADPNFDAGDFVAGSGTVYVCAPGRTQALVAPLVVGLIETIRAAAYARAATDVTSGRSRPPVVLALDEVANIAPLPDLPSVVSEGGGQGVLTLACLQDLSQARSRWGPAADGFLSLFGTKVVLPGIADLATLELVSRLAGELDVTRRSVSRGPWWSPARRVPTTTWSTQRQRRLPVDAVNQLPAGSALLLAGNAGPQRVLLGPWWSTPPFAPVVTTGATTAPSRGRRRRPHRATEL